MSEREQAWPKEAEVTHYQGTRTLYVKGKYFGMCQAETEAAEAFERIAACLNACAGMSDPAKEIAALHAENDTLRGLVAALKRPCHYCGLDDMSKCASGFPGCALADDILIGQGQAEDRLRVKAEVMPELVKALRSLVHHLQELEYMEVRDPGLWTIIVRKARAALRKAGVKP